MYCYECFCDLSEYTHCAEYVLLWMILWFLGVYSHIIWCYFCSSLQLLLQQHSLFLLNYSRSRLFLHCRKCYLKKKPLSVILVISMKLEVSVLWSGLIFVIFQETGWRFMWEKKKRMFQTIFQNFFLSIFLILLHCPVASRNLIM
jgi:hypothetical protein